MRTAERIAELERRLQALEQAHLQLCAAIEQDTGDDDAPLSDLSGNTYEPKREGETTL